MFYSTGGYYFEVNQAKKKTIRISASKYHNQRAQGKPRVGDAVEIIIKPYSAYKTEKGVVADVLTKKETHSRGHKVRLASGSVGRMVRVL